MEMELFSSIHTRSNGNSQFAAVILNKEALLFTEHFPNYPTLPGALILSVVVKLANQFLVENKLDRFFLFQVVKVSFQKRITPEYELKIVCKYEIQEKQAIMQHEFSVIDGKEDNVEFVRGRLLYKKMEDI